MAGEHCLDLSWLHPEAADLRLEIGSSDELQVAVVSPAGDVTGTVQVAIAMLYITCGCEGILAEAGRGHLRAAEVAGRDADASDA